MKIITGYLVVCFVQLKSVMNQNYYIIIIVGVSPTLAVVDSTIIYN